MSVCKFAEKVNIGQTTLNNQLLEKRALSIDVLNNILDAFPKLLAEWLMRGRGSMYVNSERCEDADETRPRIPYEVAASTLTLGADGVMLYDC